MSQVPHYYSTRNAVKLGDVKCKDGMLVDSLTDVYNKVHMGVCAEKCAAKYEFQRRPDITWSYSPQSLQKKLQKLELLVNLKRKSYL